MLHRNLAVLERRHPELARRLHDPHTTSPGASLDTGARSPREEAVYALERTNLNSAEACVILGFGTGHLVEATLERVLPGTLVVVAEASELALRQALERRSLEAALERVELSVGRPPRLLAREVAERLGPLVTQDCTVLVEDARAVSGRPEYYRRLREALESEFREAACRLAPGIRQAARNLRALLKNLPLLAGSAPLIALDGLFEGRPGLVVAAEACGSPELWAEARKAAAITVAWDCSAQPADQPDFALASTAGFGGVRPQLSGRVLVASVSADLGGPELSDAPMVVASTPDDTGRLADSLLGPCGTLRARLAPAAAAELLYRTGADPIVMAGATRSRRTALAGELEHELEALGIPPDRLRFADPDADLLRLLGGPRGPQRDPLDAVLDAAGKQPLACISELEVRLAASAARAQELALSAARAGWKLEAARTAGQARESERVVNAIGTQLLAPRDLLGLIECLRPLEGIEVRRSVSGLARACRDQGFAATAARSWAGIAARLALGATELAQELSEAGKQLARYRSRRALVRSGPRHSRCT
jgi:hypothetical protein